VCAGGLIVWLALEKKDLILLSHIKKKGLDRRTWGEEIRKKKKGRLRGLFERKTGAGEPAREKTTTEEGET